MLPSKSSYWNRRLPLSSSTSSRVASAATGSDVLRPSVSLLRKSGISQAEDAAPTSTGSAAAAAAPTGSSSQKASTSSRGRSFVTAPMKRLNIVDVDSGAKARNGRGASAASAATTWKHQPLKAVLDPKAASRASSALPTNSKAPQATKESRRARKRRLWLAKKSLPPAGDNGDQRRHGLTVAPSNGDWACLPDLVLEHIFRYLSHGNKISTSMVCHQWSRAIQCRSVWSDMVINDTFLTTSRFNYAGKFYTEVLDHIKASRALNKLAGKLRRLSFLPKNNLHVICSFQDMMTKFCGYYGPLPDISHFVYVFPCDFAKKSNEVDIFGTGGTILQNMKSLLMFLPGLKILELIDLQLDTFDAIHVLDEVSEVCWDRIQVLKITNISRRPHPMMTVNSFVNLKVLYISPHNLSDDLVESFVHLKKLRNVQVITNKCTECAAIPVDYRVWKAIRKVNPKLRIHLVTEGVHKNEIMFQQRAPVKSIVYDTPYNKVTTFLINLIVDQYKYDLECYAHKGLPRFYMAKSFHDRPDSSLLYLVRQCPYIHTLMIRERISSATVLLLAYSGENLRYFYVRQNAIVLKCDWPKSPEWSWEFYQWLRRSSRSYSSMEKEVSQILGFRWYALNDSQFKNTSLNLNLPFYYEGFEEAS